MARTLLLALSALLWASLGAAQQPGWVQIEARPSETQAVERAQDYAARLPNVNGFALPSGWYAIALGPYDPFTAEQELRRLRAEGAIPGDSFLSDGRGFGRRIYGAETLAALPPVVPEPLAAAPLPPATPFERAETLAEARAAERLLTREERAEIQEALQWEGFYNAAIDAAFGPGTRRAIGDWQLSRAAEPTGVLTTLQRRALLGDYREVLESLGMARVFDAEAGIEVAMPTGLVAFDRYEAPLAHYESTGDSGVRVILISQSGDAGTLAGLYDILQTLEIMPLEGPRELGPRSFTINGANASIVTTAHAELAGGAVKGVILTWPAGDERRRTRAWQEMRASLTPTAAVLPDLPVADAAQSADLLAGLRIRRPDRIRSGFFVSADGRVATTSAAVEGCDRVTLGDETAARVTAVDPALDLALLAPAEPLVPIGYARLQPGTPRLQSEVAVAGFPYGTALALPTLTYGRLGDLRGLGGEETLARLSLAAAEGDAGGPLFDASGAVLGLLLGERQGAQQLPADVRFATQAPALATFLSDNGVTPAAAEGTAPLDPVDLAALAADMTVAIGCWN